MKKMKRKISILLIMAMIFTTMGFSVFAVDELDNTPADTNTEEVANGVEEVTDGAEEVADDTDPTAEEAEEAEEAVTEEDADAKVVLQSAPAEEETTEACSVTNVTAALTGYAGGKANITVTWESTGDIAYFTVTPSSGTAVDVTENSADFALAPGSTYTFTVTAKDAEGNTVTDDSGNAVEVKSNSVATKTATVSDLKAHPSYNGVVLDWTKNAVADHYVVYNGSSIVATVTNAGNTSKYSSSRVLYTVTGLKEFTSYTLKVVAYYDESAQGGSASVTSQPVRPITYTLKIKSKASTTLTSKNKVNGKYGKYSLKGGQSIKAVGFNSGKYVFESNGYVYNIAKSRVSKASAGYTTAFNYDKISAESYVNRKGMTSKTNQLIWISTYTQRIYIFTGSKGKWVLKDNWDVSTGKASSPTPTGNSFTKAVWKKVKKRHGLKWWTCFSSMNAMHSAFNSWIKKLGKPASGGCVRNTVAHAKWIYSNIKMKTAVLVR